MHDGRQRPQQHVGMTAAKKEVAAGNIAPPTFMVGDRAARPPCGEKRLEVDRREGQIGCEAEGQPTWQKETVPSPEEHCIGNAFYRQPALACEHGIALDALMFWKLDGHVAAHFEAARYVTAWFQQRQH